MKTLTDHPKRKDKTWHVGGGDLPTTSIQHYQYLYYKKWWKRIIPTWCRTKIVLPFIYDTDAIPWDMRVFTLVRHPFEINGVNVVDWADRYNFRGRVCLRFADDASIEHILTTANGQELRMSAYFENKQDAVLFKLVFG